MKTGREGEKRESGRKEGEWEEREEEEKTQTQRFSPVLIIMDTTSTVSQGSKSTLIYAVLIQPRVVTFSLVTVSPSHSLSLRFFLSLIV